MSTAVADAEAVPELERPLGEADRARAFADAVGVVEQQNVLAALRKVDRQRQPHGTRANHDDPMFGDVGTGPVLVRVAAVAELGLCLIPRLCFRLRHLFKPSH